MVVTRRLPNSVIVAGRNFLPPAPPPIGIVKSTPPVGKIFLYTISLNQPFKNASTTTPLEIWTRNLRKVIGLGQT